MSTPRNAPCPCGSGRKFKYCCHGKRFHYEEDADGTIHKVVPIPPEALAALAQIVTMNERGTAPPQEMVEHIYVQSMRAVGVHPAIIHAFTVTGLILCDHNICTATGADLDEWNAAIDAWQTAHGERVARRWMTNAEFWAVGRAGEPMAARMWDPAKAGR